MSKADYGVMLPTSARVDREKGIIYGVCMMQEGEVPDRGLFVDNETLNGLVRYCKQFANGVKVKADHGTGIMAVSGILRNFRVENGAARADLHLLKEDENRDKLMEMAEEIPDTFGLSVSIEQELEESKGRMCIRPTDVFSVDLVTDPAACPNGLFSTRRIDAKTTNKMSPDEIVNKFSALEQKFSEFMSQCQERFKKYEAASGESQIDKNYEKLAADLKATREEFATKLTANNDALVTKVAAEFSKVVGQTTVQATQATAAAATEKPEEAFEKVVQEEYAKNGGSKTKAMSAAIAADMKATGGKGHAAFIAKGKSVNYAKS